MSGLVQMNTRIDGQLKADGDSVFARIGYNPTRVVRDIWEFARRHSDDLETVRSYLDGLTETASDRKERCAARRQKMYELESVRREMCIDLGIDPDSFGASLDCRSNEELRAAAISERLERYGVR